MGCVGKIGRLQTGQITFGHSVCCTRPSGRNTTFWPAMTFTLQSAQRGNSTAITCWPTFARIPTPRSTECERGICPAQDCRHRARTESRTPSHPSSPAIHRRGTGHPHLGLPTYDPAPGREAFRFVLLRGLFRAGGLRQTCAPPHPPHANSEERRAAKNREDSRQMPRGWDARLRQPGDPVEGACIVSRRVARRVLHEYPPPHTRDSTTLQISVSMRKLDEAP
jgi:hypothetical protein